MRTKFNRTLVLLLLGITLIEPTATPRRSTDLDADPIPNTNGTGRRPNDRDDDDDKDTKQRLLRAKNESDTSESNLDIESAIGESGNGNRAGISGEKEEEEEGSIDGPRQEEIDDAVRHGLKLMRDLYFVKEPMLYKMGLFLDPDEPAGRVAAFSSPNSKAQLLARYGYATVQASLKIAQKYYNGPSRESTDFSDGLLLRTSILTEQCPLRGIPRCAPSTGRYRTPDGTCNSFNHPWRGSAMTPMQRFLPPMYEDGVQSPKHSVLGGSLPSARDISITIHRDEDREMSAVTLMFMQWGQFLDHDVTSTAQARSFNGSVPRCCLPGGTGFLPSEFTHPECLPIAVPREDWFLSHFGVRCLEFIRSAPSTRIDCDLGWREQINQVTSYLDASTVYGSDGQRAEALRIFRGGQLQYGRRRSQGRLRPPDPPEGEICRTGAISTACFLGGDLRVGEQPALTSLHTIWLRYHNQIAEGLEKLNRHWTDEKLYQETRRIIGALIQHVTYREFLPLLLGQDVIKLFDLTLNRKGYYSGYDDRINPTPANSFSTAAFRFGHSLVQNSFVRANVNHRSLLNNVLIHEEQENPENIWSPGALDRLVLGLCNQASQRRDEFVSDELTNHLFQGPRSPFGMDLVALNIQRGRDHGIPSYSAWREPCGLSLIETWKDLHRVMAPNSAERFRSIYADVDDIDLYSGGLAERPVKGGIIGPTFACIIAQQFLNFRKGDRFWYENGGFESSFTPAQLQQIRRVNFAQVICHAIREIETIQPFVFLAADDFSNVRVDCDHPSIGHFDLSAWDEIQLNSIDDFDRIKTNIVDEDQFNLIDGGDDIIVIDDKIEHLITDDDFQHKADAKKDFEEDQVALKIVEEFSEQLANGVSQGQNNFDIKHVIEETRTKRDADNFNQKTEDDRRDDKHRQDRQGDARRAILETVGEFPGRAKSQEMRQNNKLETDTKRIADKFDLKTEDDQRDDKQRQSEESQSKKGGASQVTLETVGEFPRRSKNQNVSQAQKIKHTDKYETDVINLNVKTEDDRRDERQKHYDDFQYKTGTNQGTLETAGEFPEVRAKDQNVVMRQDINVPITNDSKTEDDRHDVSSKTKTQKIGFYGTNIFSEYFGRTNHNNGLTDVTDLPSISLHHSKLFDKLDGQKTDCSPKTCLRKTEPRETKLDQRKSDCSPKTCLRKTKPRKTKLDQRKSDCSPKTCLRKTKPRKTKLDQRKSDCSPKTCLRKTKPRKTKLDQRKSDCSPKTCLQKTEPRRTKPDLNLPTSNESKAPTQKSIVRRRFWGAEYFLPKTLQPRYIKRKSNSKEDKSNSFGRTNPNDGLTDETTLHHPTFFDKLGMSFYNTKHFTDSFGLTDETSPLQRFKFFDELDKQKTYSLKTEPKEIAASSKIDPNLSLLESRLSTVESRNFNDANHQTKTFTRRNQKYDHDDMRIDLDRDDFLRDSNKRTKRDATDVRRRSRQIFFDSLFDNDYDQDDDQDTRPKPPMSLYYHKQNPTPIIIRRNVSTHAKTYKPILTFANMTVRPHSNNITSSITKNVQQIGRTNKTFDGRDFYGPPKETDGDVFVLHNFLQSDEALAEKTTDHDDLLTYDTDQSVNDVDQKPNYNVNINIQYFLQAPEKSKTSKPVPMKPKPKFPIKSIVRPITTFQNVPPYHYTSKPSTSYPIYVIQTVDKKQTTTNQPEGHDEVPVFVSGRPTNDYVTTKRPYYIYTTSTKPDYHQQTVIHENHDPVFEDDYLTTKRPFATQNPNVFGGFFPHKTTRRPFPTQKPNTIAPNYFATTRKTTSRPVFPSYLYLTERPNFEKPQVQKIDDKLGFKSNLLPERYKDAENKDFVKISFSHGKIETREDDFDMDHPEFLPVEDGLDVVKIEVMPSEMGSNAWAVFNATEEIVEGVPELDVNMNMPCATEFPRPMNLLERKPFRRRG